MATHRNDEYIIMALVSSPTIKEAAKKAGVSESVIYRRLDKPEFKEKYDKARREMFDRCAASLEAYMNSAIKTMGDIVDNKDASPQTRLNAAEAIIKNTLRLTERADVLERLDALERRIQ